jgi:hypothetical protein
MIERLTELVNQDKKLVRRGQFLDVDFMVEVGDIPYYVQIRSGRVASVERGPSIMRSWSFAIRAPAKAWENFWQPIPLSGYHDIFAMSKRGDARIEGDLGPFMANLRYIKEVLAAPRRLKGGC